MSTEDLLSLIRVNKKLYSFLIDELYRNNVKTDGGSALVWYARRGNEHGVLKMLAAGAEVDFRPPSREQPSALLEAVRYNNIGVVQLLLQRGALSDSADLCSRRSLTLSTSGRGDVAITKLLLDYGASVNSVAFDKRPPLLEAIRSNQESKISLLLKHGANPHIVVGRNGMSLLHVAAAKNATAGIIGMLVRYGILVDSQDHWGRTPLQVATEHSCTRAVHLLLQQGANPNFRDTSTFSKGWTALFYSVCPKSSKYDNKSIIKTLVMHGADVDSRSNEQQTPLLYAISRGATKQAQTLLNAGASLTERNANGESVVHLPASDSYHLMNWLAESGADVNWIGGIKQETPIFYAIRHAHRHLENENVRNLLSLGADVNFRNLDGRTPLSLAVWMGSTTLTKLLLDNGAFVNTRDRQQKSPLHHAVETSFVSAPKVREIVALLIRHGANVNARDCSGYTPLHKAVTNEWIWETAGELLHAGADRCAMSDDGKFPYDMVPSGPWAETQRLFLRHYPS